MSKSDKIEGVIFADPRVETNSLAGGVLYSYSREEKVNPCPDSMQCIGAPPPPTVCPLNLTPSKIFQRLHAAYYARVLSTLFSLVR